jgi:hypothetical protein
MVCGSGACASGPFCSTCCGRVGGGVVVDPNLAVAGDEYVVGRGPLGYGYAAALPYAGYGAAYGAAYAAPFGYPGYRAYPPLAAAAAWRRPGLWGAALPANWALNAYRF